MSTAIVSWPAVIREKAKTQGKGSFGLGVEGDFGRIEIANVMDSSLAVALLFFASELNHGKSPKAAFDSVIWPEPKGGAA
jgi:hypothetical protein